MFVVPTSDRLAWLQRVGRPPASLLGRRVWAVVLADLEGAGLDSQIAQVGRAGESQPFRSILEDPGARPCPTPVGSDAWVRLLGSGGGEDLDAALR